jgi:hypothetical protein
MTAGGGSSAWRRRRGADSEEAVEKGACDAARTPVRSDARTTSTAIQAFGTYKYEVRIDIDTVDRALAAAR